MRSGGKLLAFKTWVSTREHIKIVAQDPEEKAASKQEAQLGS